MRIFPLFRINKHRPHWTYAARGTIWRILFSDSGKIIGECRDQERKSVSFFCVNGESGSPVWEGLRLDEPWWVGMEAVQGNTLLLHGFVKPDMPQHKQIVAFDVDTGKERWRNDELTYWFGLGQMVYAYRDTFEKRIGCALNLHTGAIEQTHDDSLEDLHRLRRRAFEEKDVAGFRFPEVLDPHSAEPWVGALVRREIKGKSVAGDAEFINEQGYLLLNYYTRASRPSAGVPVYDNHFVILHVERGSRVFSDVLARSAKAPVPDSFFVRFPFVYFIKDYNTLTALRLWKS